MKMLVDSRIDRDIVLYGLLDYRGDMAKTSGDSRRIANPLDNDDVGLRKKIGRGS